MPATSRFPEPTLGDDYGAAVNAWMIGAAFAHLRGFQKRQEAPPDAEALAEWIECETFEHGSAWIEHRRERYRLGAADVARMSRSVASFALQEFDPEVYRRAALGGSRSRRPRVFAPSLLDGLEHLSRREAAAALGISESTVARLRRARRADPSSTHLGAFPADGRDKRSWRR